MISPDISQYLGVFIDEGQEQIELLEQKLLEMEREEPTKETLQEMFRAAHTLKGSSRTMGFMRIGDLTHEMENVLDDMRNDKLSISTDVCNVLLECLDLLKTMMASVQTEGNDESFEPGPVESLVHRLEAVRTGSGEELAPLAESTGAIGAFSAEAVDKANQALAAEHNVFQVAIEIADNCMMKSVRVLMVLAMLNEQGCVLGTAPNEEALDREEFGATFQALVETDLDGDKLQSVIASISEIASVAVTPFDPGKAPESPKPAKAKAKKSKVADKPAANAPKEAPTQASQPSSNTIRVPVTRLDALLNLIGELVIDRSQIARVVANLEDAYGQTELIGRLNDATHRIARVTGELQEQVMKTRMLPIDGVFQRMPRMIRDLAQKTGKDVDFVVSGGETELDRSLLDVLSDPIIHLLRNSVDHGLETPDERIAAGKNPTGTVRLAARQEENHIVVEISDDGKGIDPNKIKEAAIRKGVITQQIAEGMPDGDAIKLIFASGFSTAQALSDISGRGVGMDIVRSNIEKIGGRVHVESEVGKGSRFLVHLPLTLAIVRALLVEAGTATYAIPLASVVETLRLGSDSVDVSQEKVNGRAVLCIRGETVTLANLLHVLAGDKGAAQPENIPSDAYVVIIGFADRKVGLCVEKLAGEQEVVIKPLGKLLGDVQGIAGASILGDGRVALIIDSAGAVNV